MRKFERFVDDDEENEIPNEFPECRWKCGRPSRMGLDRSLRIATHCCDVCADSKGANHDSSCNMERRSGTISDRRALKRSAITLEAVSDISNRIASVIASNPALDSDIDITDFKVLFEGICAANDLPRIDEKRFVLISSRFCIGQVIPKHKTREVLYRLLKKVYTIVHTVNENPPLARHLLVVKQSKVTKCYRFKSVLGQGSFGIVHKVIRIDSGVERVCKSISKSNTSIPQSQIESEIRIIAALDHPNIVKIVEYFEDDSHVHLIMEYCAGGDLLGRIKHSNKSGRPLSTAFIQTVIRQLLSAISFMQFHRVIHKDLKPENIMLVVDANHPDRPIVKIIDFGLSELFSTNQSTSTTVAGTAFYMSPQIFKPPFSFKADIWSVGVIAYFMLTGILPFFGSTVAEVKSNVLYRKIQWPSTFAGTPKLLQISQDAKDLVESLLDKEEATRPNAAEALRYIWLSVTIPEIKNLFSLPVALNIRSFAQLSWWKRCMLNLIAHIWEFTDISSNLTHIFLELDRLGVGFITVPQLADSLQSVGIPMKDAWVCAKAIDLTNTGKVTFTALVGGCIYPLIASDPRIVRALFNRFHPDKKDRISYENIIELLAGNRSYRDALEKGELMKTLQGEFSRPEQQPAMSASTGRPADLDFATFRRWILSLN